MLPADVFIFTETIYRNVRKAHLGKYTLFYQPPNYKYAHNSTIVLMEDTTYLLDVLGNSLGVLTATFLFYLVASYVNFFTYLRLLCRRNFAKTAGKILVNLYKKTDAIDRLFELETSWFCWYTNKYHR